MNHCDYLFLSPRPLAVVWPPVLAGSPLQEQRPGAKFHWIHCCLKNGNECFQLGDLSGNPNMLLRYPHSSKLDFTLRTFRLYALRLCSMSCMSDDFAVDENDRRSLVATWNEYIHVVRVLPRLLPVLAGSGVLDRARLFVFFPIGISRTSFVGQQTYLHGVHHGLMNIGIWVG